MCDLGIAIYFHLKIVELMIFSEFLNGVLLRMYLNRSKVIGGNYLDIPLLNSLFLSQSISVIPKHLTTFSF